MLLANSSVSGKAATGHVLKVRSHRRLSPNTRSSSKSIAPNRGALVFQNELCVLYRTSHVGGSFFVGNGVRIEALAKPIFVRGIAPSMAGAPCALFIQNHCAKSGSLGFSERTPEACTNLSYGRFVLCWERGGDRSIGKANLRKGRQPLQWKCASHPSMAGAPRAFVGNGEGDRSIGVANLRKGVALQWKRHCRPFQWPARPVPGRRTLRLVGMPHARLAPYWVRI